MRGKSKTRVPKRRRANAEALNPEMIQNGHSTSQNQNSELVSFLKTLLPLWPGIKDTTSKESNSTQFEPVLNNFFKTYTKPLEEYLDFLELTISSDQRSRSRSSSGSSLSVHCTKTFSLFLSKNSDESPVELSNEVKLRALSISSRSVLYDLKKIIFNLYKFVDSPEILKTDIPQLKKSGFHIQLSQWIRIFNGEDQFEIRDYVFPMLLERTIEHLADYLMDNPDKLNNIVKLIDTLCKGKRAIQKAYTELLERTVKSSEISIVESNAFRIIKFCIKKFNISPELIPNYNQRNEELEINFYVHSLLKDEMSEEAFEERVMPLCEANSALQDFLIRSLKKYGLYEQVQKFSKIFNKTEEECPILPPRERREVIIYYSVDNLVKMTVFVDSDELSKSMLQYIDSLISTGAGSESTIPVGLDLEWKSVCTASSILPPALFQVAFDKRVYIVDVNKLHSNTDFWTDLNDKLLKNEKFSKLGYGLQNDQGSFNYYPNLRFISLKGLGFIDLNWEERKYTNPNNSNNTKFPYEVPDIKKANKNQKGLSKLVYYCYGKFLDKREVLSDWNRRPLREAQVLYAAMDAYCLLPVYKVLEKMHKESGNNFDSTSVSSKKSNKIPESRFQKQWNNKFMRKKRFWYRKKVSVAIQVSVECKDDSTQTQSDLTTSVAALRI